MSLSDIMGGAGLAGYAEVAMILFFVTFVLIALRTLSKRQSGEWEAARLLPLQEEERPAAFGRARSERGRS